MTIHRRADSGHVYRHMSVSVRPPDMWTRADMSGFVRYVRYVRLA